MITDKNYKETYTKDEILLNMINNQGFNSIYPNDSRYINMPEYSISKKVIDFMKSIPTVNVGYTYTYDKSMIFPIYSILAAEKTSINKIGYDKFYELLSVKEYKHELIDYAVTSLKYYLFKELLKKHDFHSVNFNIHKIAIDYTKYSDNNYYDLCMQYTLDFNEKKEI